MTLSYLSSAKQDRDTRIASMIWCRLAVHRTLMHLFYVLVICLRCQNVFLGQTKSVLVDGSQ